MTKQIVNVQIVSKPADPAPIKVAVHVSDPPNAAPITVAVHILDDEALKAKVLNELGAFIESLGRKYAHCQTIEDLLANLKKQIGIG